MENQEIKKEYCPNCGEMIEQSQKFCKGCGRLLLDEADSNNQNISMGNKENIKNLLSKVNKKIIALVGVIATIICVVLIVVVANANKLTPNEEYALKKTEYLINHMNDPDSFKLQSDIIRVKLSLEGNDYYDGKDVYFIEYSAKNGFGGTITDVACFFDGEYINLNDAKTEKIYESDYDSKSDYIDALKESVKKTGPIIALKKYLTEWNLLGSQSESFKESEIISAKKIAKKAKCEYSEQ